MNRIIIASTVLLANFAGQAMAACPSGPTSGKLSALQIVSLLYPNRYACGSNHSTTNPLTWNEILTTRLATGGNYRGFVFDGGEKVADYEVTGRTANPLLVNTIKYTYGDPGGPYTYYVYAPAPLPPGTVDPGEGIYTFCNISGSPSYTISVTSNPTCTPP